jgi:hypothetical protein
MSVREIGRIFGILMAIIVGGTGTITAQGYPHPHHGERPCSGDTIRGRVLGRPVMPGGMTPGGMMHGGMMHGGMMPGGMMFGAGMSGPAAMLLHREELGLSAAQVQRLEVLAATHKRATEESMPRVLRGVADLMAASSGEIDIDAASAAYDRLSRTISEMLMTDLRLMKDARQTLTPEQQTRWDAMRDEMGVMRRMMGTMMMGMGMGMRPMGPMGPMGGPGGPMMPYRHHRGHNEGRGEHCR